MTDANTAQAPRPDRFGLTFGIAESNRRSDIAAAKKEGEPFDGLTDRDIALMVERGAHAIRAAQTVRGRFLGDDNQVFVTALYIAGTAASEDVVRLFDAIAEGKFNLPELLGQIQNYLKTVEAERDADEKKRREADAASHASILVAGAKGEGGNKDGGAAPPAVASGRHEGQQAPGGTRPAGEPQ